MAGPPGSRVESDEALLAPPVCERMWFCGISIAISKSMMSIAVRWAIGWTVETWTVGGLSGLCELSTNAKLESKVTVP